MKTTKMTIVRSTPVLPDDNVIEVRKKKLEDNIAGLVANFSKETGVLVRKINVFNDRIIFDDDLTVPAIEIKVKLLR